MNLAIELMTQKATLTDSQTGAGIKSETSSTGEAGSRFKEYMSKSRTDNRPEESIGDVSKEPRRERMEGTVTQRKSEKPEEAAKPAESEESVEETKDEGEHDDTDGTIAGLMNQNRVVFILEGEKESETIPDISVTDVTAAPDVELELPVDGGAAEETVSAEFALPVEDTLPVTENPVQDAASVQNAETEAQETVAEPVHTPDEMLEQTAEVTNTSKKTETKLETKLETKPEVVSETESETKTEMPETDNKDIGEVVARTPKIRTAEKSGTDENTNNGERSEDGDLSPLENKNDTPQVKTPKTEHEDSEEKLEPVNNSEQKPAETAPQQLADIKPEKVQATEQLRQTVPNTPVTTENMFDAMVDHIDYMKSSNTSEAAIRLKPEFLGEISLRISMGAEGLNVKIDAGDKDVRSMINSQIQFLVEELSNKGIEVAKVEVAYAGVENGMNSGTQEQQPRQSKKSRGTVGAINADDTVYALNALEEMAGYVDMEISTVEYRA